MSLKRGIEAAVEACVESIRSGAIDVSSNKEQIANVASISSADTEIGTMISEAIEKVGKDGVTKATFLHISLPTQREWKQFWITPTYCSLAPRFPPFAISYPYLRK